ncbi:MAG: hypothetical protein OXC62_07485, partial [Aestuariivita sp.]|nr:hypothetical protein [Aestuariivita sp.]
LVISLRHIPSGSVTRVLRERQLRDESDVWRHPTRGADIRVIYRRSKLSVSQAHHHGACGRAL